MRHARVENPSGVVYARLPGYHLSETGRREAGALADALRRRRISGVFASPLERAQETAELLAAPHGLSVQTDERLIEWDYWTRWEGIPWDEVRERDPEALRAFAEDPARACPEDPLEEVAERVLDWARECGSSGGLVIGVTHETPLAAAYLIGCGRPVNDLYSVRMEHLAPVRLSPPPVRLVDL